MSLLHAILADKAQCSDLGPQDWNALLAEARQANMMARLATILCKESNRNAVPQVAQEVMRGSSTYVDYLQVRARFELSRIARIAEDCTYPVIALKGAAYLLCDNAAAAGRSLSDLDVLVSQSNLEDFENRLRNAGWEFSEAMSAYDEYYYRELSHELPPMRHPKCQFELDVHHNILQPTHRFAIDADPIIEQAQAVEGSPLRTLSSADQILHSATHLTMSDELRGGLRDVHDLILIYRQELAKDSLFPEQLIDRALQLELGRPLFYVMDFAERKLGLSVPASAAQKLVEMAPPMPALSLMRYLLDQRLSPRGHNTGGTPITEFLLYVRSHWIRMPPALLARHLLRKARQRKRGA